MTLQEIIDEFRRVLDDQEEPFLWSDEDIVLYANEAMNEACERAFLLEDRTTPEVCQILLVANQSDYPLHPSVIRVKRVSVAGQVLEISSVEALDLRDKRWETRTGEARQFIVSDRTLTIVPMPQASQTAKLTVYRTPLVPFTLDDTEQESEIRDLYVIRAMEWMYALAYRKQDADTLNLKLAQQHEATFTFAFGVRPDANVQRKRRDRRPPVVHMRW